MDGEFPPLRQPRVTPEQLPEFNSMVNRLFGVSPCDAAMARQQFDRDMAKLRGEPEPFTEQWRDRFIATIEADPDFALVLAAKLGVVK